MAALAVNRRAGLALVPRRASRSLVHASRWSVRTSVGSTWLCGLQLPVSGLLGCSLPLLRSCQLL